MNSTDAAGRFRYAAFISYVHGQQRLMDQFISQLSEALKSELEPYFEDPIYIDQERHKPGDRFNPKIAEALCHSTCMVLVYVPKYENHEYTRREWRGMEELQTKRYMAVKKHRPTSGLIIPVILRGRLESLPVALRDHIHVCDFSKYKTSDQPLVENEQYIDQIKEMAEFIWERHKELESVVDEVIGSCDGFVLPDDVQMAQTQVAQPFPGRQPGR